MAKFKAGDLLKGNNKNRKWPDCIVLEVLKNDYLIAWIYAPELNLRKDEYTISIVEAIFELVTDIFRGEI